MATATNTTKSPKANKPKAETPHENVSEIAAGFRRELEAVEAALREAESAADIDPGIRLLLREKHGKSAHQIEAMWAKESRIRWLIEQIGPKAKDRARVPARLKSAEEKLASQGPEHAEAIAKAQKELAALEGEVRSAKAGVDEQKSLLAQLAAKMPEWRTVGFSNRRNHVRRWHGERIRPLRNRVQKFECLNSLDRTGSNAVQIVKNALPEAIDRREVSGPEDRVRGTTASTVSQRIDNGKLDSWLRQEEPFIAGLRREIEELEASQAKELAAIVEEQELFYLEA